MKKLVIDRPRWLRGNKSSDGDSHLLHPIDKTMCCLGFLALSCGVKEADIMGEYSPKNLGYREELPRELYKDYDEDGDIKDSKFCEDLMIINDSIILLEKDREKQLIERFKEMNIQLSFVDEHANQNHQD